MAGKERIKVAVVAGLYRYPVKSMRGEAVAAAKLGWHGIAGDRRYAFVQEEEAGGFPWLTARECPALVLYSPRFDMPSNPAGSSITVQTPGGTDWPLRSEELTAEIERLSRRRVRLMQLDSGIFDAMDLSLISTSTIRELSSRTGGALDVRRFRPNILVEPTDERPYPEEEWVGERLAFGERSDSARVHVCREDPRCPVVNVDPGSGLVDGAILRAIVTARRKNLAGVYGTTGHPGSIEVGDAVWLEH
jgi:uncharacterized protein YcbX